MGRGKRSRKRSAASSPPPESVTFFVDRSLGRTKIVAALRAAGVVVKAHDELFAQDTPDTVWLEEAGRQGWAVLSKDRRIRSRRNELAQLLSAGVAAFVLTAADLTGDQMATAFRVALPRMLRMLATRKRPFIARVGRSGDVELVVLPKAD